MYSPLIFSDNKDPAYEDPFVKASSETIRPAPRLSILQAILAVLDLPENPSLDDILEIQCEVMRIQSGLQQALVGRVYG